MSKEHLIAETRVIKENGYWYIEYKEERTFLERFFFYPNPWQTLWCPYQYETVSLGGERCRFLVPPVAAGFKTLEQAETTARSLIGSTQGFFRSPEGRRIVSHFGGAKK